MSSQDSEGESYVANLVSDPKTYGDLSPYGRTTDDEEDAHLMRIDDSSSEEEDVPLPQPGDMHIKSRSPVFLRELTGLITDLFLLVFNRKAKEIYVTRS